MAFSGIDIVHFVAPNAEISLPCISAPGCWSEHGATTSGVTTKTVGEGRASMGVQYDVPCVAVRSSFDAFVSIAKSPDVSTPTSPRWFVPANSVEQFIAEPGSKVAWIAA